MRKNERDRTNGRVFATTCVCWFVFVVPKRHWLCRRVLIRCVFYHSVVKRVNMLSIAFV